MNLRNTVHAIISQGDRYFVAECMEIPVVTQGLTVDETLANLKELWLWLCIWKTRISTNSGLSVGTSPHVASSPVDPGWPLRYWILLLISTAPAPARVMMAPAGLSWSHQPMGAAARKNTRPE